MSKNANLTQCEGFYELSIIFTHEDNSQGLFEMYFLVQLLQTAWNMLRRCLPAAGDAHDASHGADEAPGSEANGDNPNLDAADLPEELILGAEEIIPC